MSDHERAIIEAIDALAAGEHGMPPSTQPPAGDDELRACAEAFALLPFAERPQPPRPAIRRRLLQTIGGAPAAAGDPPAPVARLADRPRALASRPFLALAALLALSVAGLAFLAGRLGEQGRRLEQLQQQVLTSSIDSEQLASLQAELAEVSQHLTMVTSIARRKYPLHTVATSGTIAARAHGTIWVCGQHQRWYLNLEGIEPPDQGHQYYLWFLTDDGPVSGGILEVGPDSGAERSDLTMPAGTHGFSVTLETAGPHQIPEGMPLLLGDQAVEITA